MKTLILIFSLISGFWVNAETLIVRTVMASKAQISNICAKETYKPYQLRCLEEVTGKRYQIEALNICAAENYFPYQLSCLKEVTGKRYQIEALNICAAENYFPYQLRCLETARSSQMNSRSGQFELGLYDIDFTSTNTPNIVKMYKALAAISVKERADFLIASSANLTQNISEDANVFAGMILAKIVNLSSSQAVKDNFEKPMQAFTDEFAKNSWKSIDQIEARVSTLGFATRVLSAGLKLKLGLAQSNAYNQTNLQADLVELGRIAAMTRLLEKLSALQSFCERRKDIFNELIQDPRYSVLGMVTADVMGWIVSK